MSGKHTKKIVAFETRIKKCRICDHAKKSKTAPRTHSCRKNWHGSSKAMEADMVVSMVTKIESDTATVQTIIGDEDATAVARVRQEINPKIEKKSDSNHIKKILGNELYSLRKCHKISVETIRYLQKNFNFMCYQNQGNPEGIKHGLDALSRHPFDDHSHCDSSWCKHIENPNLKYSSLPYGKPLSSKHGQDLQRSLQQMFSKYKDHSSKLASLESTQVNENFNSIVASKAPKRQHFSGSESLDFRVCAATSQKNEGYNYLSQVYDELGLSPGDHTQSRADNLNKRISQKREQTHSRSWKRRRQQLKRERLSQVSVKEIREGDSYSSGICIEKAEADIEEIPDPFVKPQSENVADITSEKVVFDLETTGLGRQSHIIQIAAVSERHSFSCYVLPKIPIHKQAEQVTGISCDGHQLFCNGKPVASLPIKAALHQFFQFLGNKPIILMGHNIKSFDCHILWNAVTACGITQQLTNSLHGFIDTLPMFKDSYTTLGSYKQEALYQHFFTETYEAHNAVCDVEALQKLVAKAGFYADHLLKHSFTVAHIAQVQEFNKLRGRNMKTWSPLLHASVVSKSMAEKAAGTGLSVGHLRLAHQRDGHHGVERVLTETTAEGKPRVTKHRRILSQITGFINNH